MAADVIADSHHSLRADLANLYDRQVDTPSAEVLDVRHSRDLSLARCARPDPVRQAHKKRHSRLPSRLCKHAEPPIGNAIDLCTDSRQSTRDVNSVVVTNSVSTLVNDTTTSISAGAAAPTAWCSPPCIGVEEEKSYEPDDDSTTQDRFNAVDVTEQLAELTKPSVAAVTADAVEQDFLKIPPHPSHLHTSTFPSSQSAAPTQHSIATATTADHPTHIHI